MEHSGANHLLFTVASIINPGRYVVLSRDSKHKFKISCMETALSEGIRLDDEQDFCDLKSQTYVIVEDPQKERNFKRGVISRKIDRDVYEVFLMDVGQFVRVKRSKIRELVEENITEIQSLAFVVILHGIIPTEYCTKKDRMRVSQQWCEEAEILVKELLTTNNEVKVKKVLVKPGIVYGDLLFRPNVNKSFVSLSEMLRNREFCIYSVAYFTDKVLNATEEESTAEIKFWEVLNVPFHRIDNKGVMCSVIKVPIGEEEHFKTRQTYGRESNLRDHEPTDSYSSNSTSALINLKKLGKCGLGISTSESLGRGRMIISMAKKYLKERTPGGSIRLSTSSTRLDDDKSERKTNNGSSKEVSNMEKKVFPKNKLQCVWSEVYGNPLVLFTDSVVKPVDNFTEMPISPTIVNNLQRKGEFSSVKPLQRWTIPSIRENHNVVMIGNSKTGKTLSYIIAVADFVQDENYLAGLPDGNGPFVLIACSSVQTGRFVYDMCHYLLGNDGQSAGLKSKIKIVLVHTDDSNEEIRAKLANECHVLISTPHCLNRLLRITNYDRLKCLILDEVDVLTKEPFKSPMYKVLHKANLSTRNCQKIFCGKKWTPQVNRLVNSHLTSYITVMASYLELAVYAEFKPSIHVVDKKSKLDVVLEKIANCIGKFKILVACEKETEANHVYDCLRRKGIHSLLAHEKLMNYELAEVHSKWSYHSPHPVLIATDGALVDLNVKDVQILVHYTVPSKSKTNFFTRYSTFVKTIFGNDQFQDLKETVGYTDIVLLEYDDVRQFPHVVEYVLRLGGIIAPKALEIYDLIRRRKELEKVNTPICRTLLSFGSCEKWENGEDCSYRHAFQPNRDSFRNVFTDGWVTFAVLKVYDVSSFSARILTYIQSDGKKVKIIEQSLQIPERLEKYYGFEDNRRPHGLPRIGDVCSVKHKVGETELFYRAEIIEFTKVDKYNNPVAVNVRLLDQGDIIETKNIGLYCLPDDLADLPPLTVEIKVVGLRPWDYEKVWGNVAVKFAEDILTKELDQNEYWSGKIALTLNNTLFLEYVAIKRFLHSIKCDVVEICYQDELLKNKMSIKNTEHLPKLLELCSKGNVEQSKKEGENKNELASRMVEPKWAFFEKDFNRVKFSSAENGRTIFLLLKECKDLLVDIELACEEEAANRMRKDGADLTEGVNSELCPGMYCLALFENQWNRGRIESIEDGGYLIFFIDHGDFASVGKSCVIPISESLLQQLPCQAIECSLVGIKEKEELSKEVLDEIYNFSEDGLNDLYAYVINKNSEAEVTGGQKFLINLLSLKGVSLNKLLIEKKLVDVVDSEKQYLEDIELDVSDQEEEEVDMECLEKEISELNVKEPSEKSFDVTHLERYLEEMSDGSAHSFFEEFASRFLGESYFRATNSKVTLEGSEIKNTDSINQASKNLASSQQSQSEQEVGIVENENKTEKLDSEHNIKGTGKKESICDISKQVSKPLKSCAETEEKLKIFNQKNILTPKMLWFQADGEIRLKIMIDNVKNYSLYCTTTNILFRCFVREKIYAVDLKLYGVVNPSMTTVSLQTFQVVIKLQKLSFPRWPRLHKDEIKYVWINADVEDFKDPEEVEPSIEIGSGYGGGIAGRQRGLSRNVIHYISDSESSDAEDNTDIFREDEAESESDIEN